MNDFTIVGETIRAGERRLLPLPTPKFYTSTPLETLIHVVNGKKEGPCLLVCAAIHGDEINGVEIIRRLLKHSAVKDLKGTLLAIPIVNIHGFVQQSRYLPDRRDLNRNFPGSKKGSLAARLANTFMKEVVAKCTHAIDLHTASVHRFNIPQIRANLEDKETLKMAQAFSVPLILNSNLRDGSLREAANEFGIPMLLYEAGEALRFDEVSIRAGLTGILRVMREIGMLAKVPQTKVKIKQPTIAQGSTWVRATNSGTVNFLRPLGAVVKKKELIAKINDPFGIDECKVLAPSPGVIIGQLNNPLVYEGDALCHIAYFNKIDNVLEHIEEFNDHFNNDVSS